MQITIHYSTKTGTIKQAFNRMFPYLRIEFIKPCDQQFSSLPLKSLVLHNRYLGEINKYLKQGSIDITGDYKAASVEQLFKEYFGLPVLVLRKQKKQWVEASSDEHTLAEQNEMAKLESAGASN